MINPGVMEATYYLAQFYQIFGIGFMFLAVLLAIRSKA